MKPAPKTTDGNVVLTRRRMLMRLGLAATAIYAAPVLLQLSEARASGPSGLGRVRTIRRRVRRAASYSGPSRRRYVRRPYRANTVRRRRIGSFSGPSFSR